MSEPFHLSKKYRREVAQCSRCGFCRMVCPIFEVTKNWATNAGGKMVLIKELIDGRVEPSEGIEKSLLNCTTCMNCTINCPSGVDPPEVVRAARKDMVALGYDNVFKTMSDVIEKTGNLYGEEEKYDWGHKKETAPYVLFVGCVGTYRERESVEETIKLLDTLGVDFTMIDEVCCSGVLEDVGYQARQKLAKHNIDEFHRTGAKTLITTCPYCYRTFKHHPFYQDLNLELKHITQFLAEYDFAVKTDKEVTYHDPCDLGRHEGIYEEPREIIRKIAPNFVEPERTRENAMCCGAGGGLRGSIPKESITIARARLRKIIEETGAEILLTECPSCLHNFRNAKLRRWDLEIYNITEFISMLYQEKNAREDVAV
jgi:Fe-S oxidoreductase